MLSDRIQTAGGGIDGDGRAGDGIIATQAIEIDRQHAVSCDRDQLEMFRWLHRDAGFFAFQKAVTLMSFDPDFYNANKTRLLGPAGGWNELNGRYPAHSRLIDACIAYESRSRLGQIKCPALIIHAGQDQVTSPRVTRPIEQGIPNAVGVMMEDVAHVVAGRDQKRRFCEILLPFLASH